MFFIIKGVLVIVCLCYLFIEIPKIQNIIRNFKYENDSITILEIMKELQEESFLELGLTILHNKNFKINRKIENNIFISTKNNKEYLVFLDNTMNYLDEYYGKVLYGYLLNNNIDKIVIFFTGNIEDEFLDFFNSIKDIEVIYFSKNEFNTKYTEFILNS